MDLALLKLDPRRIPTVSYLNEQIQPRTGWRIERTVVRYTLADDWYQKFAQRIFLITDYLRTRDQMEFTPEPDMFHDIFGHLPYLTQNFYARIEDKFAPAYLKATETEREVIKRLAWYSTEFGLVMEDNRFKVFGAGRFQDALNSQIRSWSFTDLVGITCSITAGMYLNNFKGFILNIREPSAESLRV